MLRVVPAPVSVPLECGGLVAALRVRSRMVSVMPVAWAIASREVR
jgi:hypothetical protein